MKYPIIIHGSENSLDIDAYVIVPEPMDMKAAKILCDSYKEINANLLAIKDGKVIWSYKGTEDECNNSILATYSLHKQTVPCPVTDKVQRNYGHKMIRTIRGLLSYNSRTHLREDVKKALSNPLLEEKLTVLKMINLNEVTDFQKTTLIETYKFFAFQLGQTLALLEDNVELFTKNTVGNYYPELKPYLNREPATPEVLQKFYERFITFIEDKYKKVDKHNLYVTNFFSHKEVLDCKKEMVLPPVVIFDIDGTLMDESHRSEHRDKKDWETYFSLCDLDTPFEPIIELTKQYKAKGYEVWLMTGRAEMCKEKTIQSMNQHGVVYDHLKMRSKDVMIPDYVLKPAWVSKYIGLERVEAVYDDREDVLNGFRKKGLNAIDVKPLREKIKSLKP